MVKACMRFRGQYSLHEHSGICQALEREGILDFNYKRDDTGKFESCCNNGTRFWWLRLSMSNPKCQRDWKPRNPQATHAAM